MIIIIIIHPYRAPSPESPGCVRGNVGHFLHLTPLSGLLTGINRTPFCERIFLNFQLNDRKGYALSTTDLQHENSFKWK